SVKCLIKKLRPSSQEIRNCLKAKHLQARLAFNNLKLLTRVTNFLMKKRVLLREIDSEWSAMGLRHSQFLKQLETQLKMQLSPHYLGPSKVLQTKSLR